MFWPPRPPWRSPASPRPPASGLREALPHLPADPGLPGQRDPARVPQRRRRGARGGAELQAARGGPAAAAQGGRGGGPWGTGDPAEEGPAPGWGVAGGDLGQGRGSGVGTHVCRCLERVLDWGPPGSRGGEGQGAGLRLGFVQRTRANRESQGPEVGERSWSQGSGLQRVGWRRAGDQVRGSSNSEIQGSGLGWWSGRDPGVSRVRG